MRDRLIELLMNTPRLPITVGGRTNGKTYQTAGNIADHLLANGVVVPPCKLGDKVYYITGIHNTLVKEAKVEEIYVGESGFAFQLCSNYTYFTLQQEEVFLSREEAEQKLKEGAEE